MTKTRIRVEDLVELQYVGDPNVSPDENSIVFVHTTMDEQKDGYPSTLYEVDTKGQAHPLTFHYDEQRIIKDRAPRWSPDGSSIAFLTNRTGKNEVWLLPMKQRGEAQPLIQLDDSIVDFSWSPDGQSIACIVSVADEGETNDSDVSVITRLRYKEDGNRSFVTSTKHVGLFELDGRTYTQISPNDGAYQEVTFSHDGTTLYYTGSTDERRELKWIPSIYAYDLQVKEEKVLFEGKGPISSLATAPDGNYLAFVGHMYGETMSYNQHVWLIDLSTGECSNISGLLDRTVDNVVRVDASFDGGKRRIAWKKDGSSLYFSALDHGSVRLYETDTNGNVSEPYTPIGVTITSFAVMNDESIVSVQADAYSTGDLILHSTTNDDQVRLTDLNQALLSSRVLSTPERITYTSVDQYEVEGWIMFPPSIKQSDKIPMILQIHGGPHSAYGYGFQHEWQWLAAEGYAVLYVNPRGSQGYGESFLQQVVGDWGGKDYEDLMHGIDYILGVYPQLNKDALFVTGASYGGYMTNMITARTNRFKAAITQNAVVNLHSMFGTSDIGFYFNCAQLGDVDLWKDEDKIMKFSPIRYAPQVKTPTLILHNEQDHRCPMEQAEQWYVALRRLGVDTKLVRFPDEDHGMSSSGRPAHRFERLHHIGDWLNHYLQE